VNTGITFLKCVSGTNSDRLSTSVLHYWPANFKTRICGFKIIKWVHNLINRLIIRISTFWSSAILWKHLSIINRLVESFHVNVKWHSKQIFITALPVTFVNVIVYKNVLAWSIYYHYWDRWISDWLVFNTKWAFSHLYHDENKLHFDEMIMMSALYKTNTLRLIFIVLAHCPTVHG
jgi:hypothetical protein